MTEVQHDISMESAATENPIPEGFSTPIPEPPQVPVNPYALSPAWSKADDFKKPFDYTTSLGQVVELRRLDMADLLRLGVAEDFDVMSKSLMTENKPSDDESAQQSLTSAIMKADNFDRMENMINLVCQAGVLQPKLYAVPLHEKARQAGLVYIDSVPFSERMELFSVIFETEGLSDFRQEQEPSVANVADVPSVPLPADGPVGI